MIYIFLICFLVVALMAQTTSFDVVVYPFILTLKYDIAR